LAEQMKVEKYILSRLIPYVDEIIWAHWYLFWDNKILIFIRNWGKMLIQHDNLSIQKTINLVTRNISYHILIGFGDS